MKKKGEKSLRKKAINKASLKEKDRKKK